MLLYNDVEKCMFKPPLKLRKSLVKYVNGI